MTIKTTAIRLLCGAGVVALASAANAQATDPEIFNNGVVGNTLLSSQNDTVYPFDSQVADDFMLGSAMDITGITWSGGYFQAASPITPNTSAFNVFIYADNGSGTAPAGGPGTELASFIIPFGSIAVTPTLVDQYDYSVDLGGSFSAAAGTTYWLAIQSENTFPPQWGWGGDNTSGGNAVAGFPLLAVPYWSPTPTAPTEMVFGLNGVVPAPGTAAALLGMAGFASRRRRS